MKTPDVIGIAVVGAILVATCFIDHERQFENQSLRNLIQAEVKAEMDKRYRNVPRIEIEKVYTLQATGNDLAIDVVREVEQLNENLEKSGK
jgi:hypothetical protein